MESMRSNISVSTLALALCFLGLDLLLAPPAINAQLPNRKAQHRTTQPKHPAVKERTTPYSLADLLTILQEPSLRADLDNLVTKYGLAFHAGDLLIQALRELGASEFVLKQIEIPPPPKPAVAGPFSVVCRPFDCEILISNRYYGRTQNGLKTVTGLSPGLAEVQVFDENLIRQSARLNLEENKPTEREFTTQRDPLYRRDPGRELVLQILTGLGGIEGISDTAVLNGSGTLAIEPASGERKTWSVKLRKSPSIFATTVEVDRQQCIVAGAGTEFDTKCTGKGKPPERSVQQGLTLAVNLLRDNFPSAILSRVLSGNAIPVPESAPEQLNFPGERSYSLKWNKEWQPSYVHYLLDSKVITVIFENYLKVGRGMFPSSIKIEMNSGDFKSLSYTFASLDNREAAEPRRPGLFGR